MPTFFEKPKHNHHIVLLILLAVALVAFALAYVLQGTSVDYTPAPMGIIPTNPGTPAASSGSDITVRKNAILQRLASAPSSPLSASEKSAMIGPLWGDKINDYHFTDAERQQLLTALNATSTP